MRPLVLALLAGAVFALPATAQQGRPGAHFIEQWDDDGDGSVTLAEATRKRGGVFYMFDTDEDGVLDEAEYDAFDAHRAADMAQPGHGRGMGHAAQGMLRTFNDADGDGKVTEAEFLGAAEGWFTQMDRNGDGVVTTDDFGPMGG